MICIEKLLSAVGGGWAQPLEAWRCVRRPRIGWGNATWERHISVQRDMCVYQRTTTVGRRARVRPR